MDRIKNRNEAMKHAGLPYDDLTWHSIDGQPFGVASRFNVIVFDDANNIVDVEGPVAIGGSFYSPRGFSAGFARDRGYGEIPYSPDLVRFLTGGSVAMSGPLVVKGHVVSQGGFRAAKGSTYLIGKDGMDDQLQELKDLYEAKEGSPYWTPSDKGDHYVIPSYDVPRYIPAERIHANISGFFQDARKSIGDYKSCIEALEPNGSVVDNSFEWILRGNDPAQNVFLIDVRPNGLITKGIRAEVPEGSTIIVKLITGDHAHLQYGLYGEQEKANNTLYVFEDAKDIHMEKSSDIWGSILAPQAMFHGHPTGGHVSGNAALRGFAVNEASGFEFHYYPFIGTVVCQGQTQPEVQPPVQPPVRPEVKPPVQPPVQPPVRPEVKPPVQPEVQPPVRPEVKPPVQPEVQPSVPCPTCPTCPAQEPCPTCPTCPAQEPCPTCPTCPVPEPCPVCPTCPACPVPEPCPVCPTCPACPVPEPCPVCPTCPACPVLEPCPVCPVPPAPKPCPVCEECLVKAGLIKGCIWGCHCCNYHQWDVKLYKRYQGIDTLLFWEQINGCGGFEFTVPYEACYILEVRLCDNSYSTLSCKPIITFNNVGVAEFMLD
ncbi:collagen-binding domain-containing protein [Clostridium sp. HBUAS56010]|uniref:collagen-binding domain-containing protein n=1 Tax=Clostridium sp. HBUAS56010 TaxID=2571127 RepID=UPI0011786BA0|nr:collagen-binding domain-containing protein [Clostridium sp. HBUAS56010]